MIILILAMALTSSTVFAAHPTIYSRLIPSGKLQPVTIADLRALDESGAGCEATYGKEIIFVDYLNGGLLKVNDKIHRLKSMSEETMKSYSAGTDSITFKATGKPSRNGFPAEMTVIKSGEVTKYKITVRCAS
jgi:hypothetical protein